jgi:hypothetical protein
MISSIHIDTAPPDGGIPARRGFAYQDLVAVHYCLSMLELDGPVAVACETYDDIVLYWGENGIEVPEFTQVKHYDLTHFWSIAELCKQRKSESNGKNSSTGHSILEKNLARDKFTESARFRIVTSLPVHNDMKVLTLPRGSEERLSKNDATKSLIIAITKYLPNTVSPKGNGLDYWVQNTSWECCSEGELDQRNRHRVQIYLENMGILIDSRITEQIYFNLLISVQNAAKAAQRDKEQKIIKADALREQIQDWIEPFPNVRHDIRLEMKLEEVNLPPFEIEQAKDLCRKYRKQLLDPGILPAFERNYFTTAVLDQLHTLSVKFNSGELKLSPIDFHSTCINSVHLISEQSATERQPPPGFLTGCMYDITSRCKHRFKKVSHEIA